MHYLEGLQTGRGQPARSDLNSTGGIKDNGRVHRWGRGEGRAAGVASMQRTIFTVQLCTLDTMSIWVLATITVVGPICA